MTIGELKEKLDKTKLKDSDDVAVLCNNKRYKTKYANSRNYPLRDSLFTQRIFEIVVDKIGE